MNGSFENPDDFAADLKRRSDAAKGLEKDLLTEVPLLYGSPGRREPHGDPGIFIARMHRQDMQRRNGGGAPPSTRRRQGVSLPFERMIAGFALVLAVLFFLLD
ncbi:MULTISPECIES: hypothetical protein [Sphingomonas]|uniref:hypothetical protein n=1 Tax=Sphingomonas TaxID=13687 RepID=UPI000F7F05B9|nr:hypothetical protein [Sphingomonas sp. ABOLF]RSV13809.1 hypothetical protein CA235_14170 [Sphingomonas sp. ABOLF]